MQKLLYLLFFTPFLAFSQPKTTIIPGFKHSGFLGLDLARDAGTGTIFMLERDLEIVKTLNPAYLSGQYLRSSGKSLFAALGVFQQASLARYYL